MIRGREWLYLILLILGTVLPWRLILQFMAAHGSFDLGAFLAATAVNKAATSVGVDILLAALSFQLWATLECRRLGMRGWWAYALVSFTVALSAGVPLFLFMRARHLRLRAAAVEGPPLT